MPLPSNPRPATERWFVKRGVPHLIADYSPSTRVWTRAKPFLIGVLLLEAMLPFSDRYAGASQGLVFLASVGLMLAAVSAFNRLRGRSLFDSLDEVELPELAFFVLAPAAVIFILDTDRVVPALCYALANLGLLALVYIVVGFGLLPMIRWSVGNMGHHLQALSRLFARTLPVLLVLTVFMFINAEIWQVAHLVGPPAFSIVGLLVVLIGLGFLWLSSDEVVEDVDELESWDDVLALVGDSPLAGTGPPDVPFARSNLTRGGRFNLRILVLVSLTTQVVLVGLLVIGFYLVMGAILMNGPVLELWTEAADIKELVSYRVGGLDLLITREHLRVSGLVGALAGLNIAVSALTDQAYRATFLSDLAAEIGENLAVERLYSALPDRTQPGSSTTSTTE